MKKATRILLGSLILTVVLIITVVSVAAAAGPNNGDCPGGGECLYVGECLCDGECQGDCDCFNDCDCLRIRKCQYDGECQGDCQYLRTREGQKDVDDLNDGLGQQIRAQNCIATCTQTQNNAFSGGEGNTYANQNCNTFQNMYGVGKK